MGSSGMAWTVIHTIKSKPEHFSTETSTIGKTLTGVITVMGYGAKPTGHPTGPNASDRMPQANAPERMTMRASTPKIHQIPEKQGSWTINRNA